MCTHCMLLALFLPELPPAAEQVQSGAVVRGDGEAVRGGPLPHRPADSQGAQQLQGVHAMFRLAEHGHALTTPSLSFATVVPSCCVATSSCFATTHPPQGLAFMHACGVVHKGVSPAGMREVVSPVPSAPAWVACVGRGARGPGLVRLDCGLA